MNFIQRDFLIAIAFSLIIIGLMILTSCSTFEKSNINIDHAGKIEYYEIATGNAMLGGNQSYGATGNVPVSGMPLPIDLNAEGSALLHKRNIDIGTVDEFMIYRFMSGNQNIDISKFPAWIKNVGKQTTPTK